MKWRQILAVTQYGLGALVLAINALMQVIGFRRRAPCASLDVSPG